MRLIQQGQTDGCPELAAAELADQPLELMPADQMQGLDYSPVVSVVLKLGQNLVRMFELQAVLLPDLAFDHPGGEGPMDGLVRKAAFYAFIDSMVGLPSPGRSTEGGQDDRDAHGRLLHA
jgi:hypothetical protein